MSSTVEYKGATLTTVDNDTRVLETAGTWLEDDVTITDISTHPSGTKTVNIVTNGTTTEDITNYANVSITTAVPASEVDSGSKSISITSNGTTTENVVGYATASITTNVPASAVDTGTKSITANGIGQDVIGYASVDVNVPNTYTASDEGMVVSNGALVAQTSDTVTANDTYDTTLINSLTVNVPTGSSKYIHGEFLTQSSTGTRTVQLLYSGSGYPIMAYIVVKGGAYVSGTTWYTTIQRYAIGVWAMSKSDMSLTPTYTTSGTQNQAVTMSIYKNSTSSSTSYTRTSAMNTNTFSSSNATAAAATAVRFRSNNMMSVYVNTSSYGFLPNTFYEYFIVYSS